MQHGGEDSPDKLRSQMLATYSSLRLVMGLTGFTLPTVLWILGHLHAEVCLQGSMSAYYWATQNGHTMRDWFVGSLFLIGAFLYAYKGYSLLENILLNVAGGLAILVALNPMPWADCKLRICGQPAAACPPAPYAFHDICAIAFFICIAIVCIFRADDTLTLAPDRGIPNPDKFIRRLRLIYRAIGIAMIVLPIASYVVFEKFFQDPTSTFLMEASGVMTFGTYWLVKTWELSKTAAEQAAINGHLVRHNGELRLLQAVPGDAGK